jgi:hypothetical protein
MQQLHNSSLRRIQGRKTLLDNLFFFDAPLDKFRLDERGITAIAIFIQVRSVELVIPEVGPALQRLVIAELQNPRPRRANRRIEPFALLVNGQEHFLNDIFRLGLISKNLERQAQDGAKETQEQQIETVFATVRDVMKQRFIAQQSDMRVSRHFRWKYRGEGYAQQGAIAQFIFCFSDTNRRF